MVRVFRVLAVLAILFIGGKVIGWVLLPSASDKAKKLVTEMNAKAPIDLVPGMKITKADFMAKEMRVIIDTDPRIIEAFVVGKHKIDEDMRKQACSNPLWMELTSDISIRYQLVSEGVVHHNVVVAKGSCKA